MPCVHDCIDKIATGKRIGIYMGERGITVSEMADKLGITPNAVRHYIQGRNYPSLPILYRMSEIFGVSCEDILAVYREEKENE